MAEPLGKFIRVSGWKKFPLQRLLASKRRIELVLKIPEPVGPRRLISLARSFARDSPTVGDGRGSSLVIVG